MVTKPAQVDIVFEDSCARLVNRIYHIVFPEVDL